MLHCFSDFVFSLSFEVEQELFLKSNVPEMYLQSFLNTTSNRNASFQALIERQDTTNKNPFVRQT